MGENEPRNKVSLARRTVSLNIIESGVNEKDCDKTAKKTLNRRGSALDNFEAGKTADTRKNQHKGVWVTSQNVCEDIATGNQNSESTKLKKYPGYAWEPITPKQIGKGRKAEDLDSDFDEGIKTRRSSLNREIGKDKEIKDVEENIDKEVVEEVINKTDRKSKTDPKKILSQVKITDSHKKEAKSTPPNQAPKNKDYKGYAWIEEPIENTAPTCGPTEEEENHESSV